MTSGIIGGGRSAVHLTWADVDFENETVRVSPKSTPLIPWTPKSYESRTVPVPVRTLDLLAKRQAECPDGHPFVFVSPGRWEGIQAGIACGLWTETKAALNGLHKAFAAIVVRAGDTVPTLVRKVDGVSKPTVTMHDLRRSAIKNWSRAINLQTVMRLAGHSNVTTTMKFYAAVMDDQIELARQVSAEAIERKVVAK